MKTERKMLIAAILLAIMVLNCVMPILQVGAATDEKIAFDSNLYAALKKELIRQNIDAGYIDDQRTIVIGDDEIAKVTDLSLANGELTDLTGLDVFKNLSTLDLSSNELDKNSNLEVLNSLNLSTLDLSSNAIEDVSMITNLDNIQNLYLHNQKFNVVEIIEVDTSETSDQITQVTYALPQILSRAGYLKTEWLIEENHGKQYGYPYINWSRFDHKNIKVEVANKTATGYVPYKDMVTLRIKVSDSTNKLYNSDINMFFIVVEAKGELEERGIHIPDKNMYKAIKEQLTEGQTVNSDLISYNGTTPSSLKDDLYERYYDEPQVLVIDIDDIINKIPSLILSNKQIKRLDGIEKFVGLEKELDLSGNYIKSIDKLIELQENQIKEEALLRERVSKQLGLISETISKITEINTAVEAEEKIKAELVKAKEELENKLSTLEAEVATLKSEKEALENDRDKVDSDVTDLQNKLNTLNDELNKKIDEKAELNKQLNGETNEDGSIKTKGLVQQLEDLNQDLKDYKAELAEAEAGNAELLENISNKENEIKQAQTAIEDAKQKIEVIQKDIDAKIAEQKVVTDEIATKNTTIAIYETKITDINMAIIEKEEEIAVTVEVLKEAKYAEYLVTDDEINEIINGDGTAANYGLSSEISDLADDYYETNEVYEMMYDENDELILLNQYHYVYDWFNNLVKAYMGNIYNLSTTEQDIENAYKVWDDGIDQILDEIRDADEYYLVPEGLTEDECPELYNMYKTASQDLVADFLTKYEKVNSALNITEAINLHNQYIKTMNEDENIAKITSTIAKLEEEKNNLQAEIDALTAEIENDNGLEDQRTAIASELKDLQEELEKEKNALETAKDNLAVKEKELTTLKTQLEESTYTQEANEIKEDIAAKEEDIAAKQEEIAALEAKITAKDKEIADKQNEIDVVQKQITSKNTEKADKQKLVDEKKTQYEAKLAELTKLITEINKQNESILQADLKIAALQSNLGELYRILDDRMARLYEIYNRVDKLASIATPELKTATEEEINNLTFEEAKSMYEAQISKLASIEKTLTSFETKYFIQEYGIDIEKVTTVTKETLVQNEDGTTRVERDEVTERTPIENPISTHFQNLDRSTWSLSNYRSWINNFRRDDIYFSMATYCYLVRNFEGLTSCKAGEYVDIEIENLEFDGEDTTYLVNAKNLYSDIIDEVVIDVLEDGTKVYYDCENAYGNLITLAYAARMVNASGDISTYVCLDRVKSLNISENLIQNIDRISELTELRILDAYDNEIINISTIDWASMTKLRILDLGFNGISDISPLENLVNIEEIYLKKNLISGSFDFDISKLEFIRVLDVSENQIDDIEALVRYLTYEARANSGKYVDENGKILEFVDAKGNVDVAKFLRAGILDIRLNNQTLKMTVDNKFEVNETRKVDLPKIFSQIEDIDYSNTSFGINSYGGNVTSDGKEVILDTTREGNIAATVTIINTKTEPSIGSGTSCTIYYTVGDIVPVNVTITPEVSEIYIGEEQQFVAEVTGDNVTYKEVTWELEGATSAQTTLSETGLLTVGLDETADKIIVRARSVYDETVSAQMEITVIKKLVTSVSLTPATATIYKGESQEFIADVIGEGLEDADKEILWDILIEKTTNEAGEEVTPSFAEGTIVKINKNKLTLAIGKEETVKQFIVVAKSKFDQEKVAQATVTIDERIVSEIIITPETATLEKGNNQTFTATVNGENLRDEDKAVEWSISGNRSLGTTISKDGILTIADDEKSEKIIVKATSKYDETKSKEVEITIIQKEVTGVVITPEITSVEKGKTQTFATTVNGKNLTEEEKAITYSVIGNTSNNTTITNEGLLTVASDETATMIKVKATSNFDNTKVAEAIITITTPAVENPGEIENPGDNQNPGNDENTNNVNLGYTVDEEYVLGVATKTPIDAFKAKMATGYTVVVKDAEGTEIQTGYVKTGMFAEVKDETGNVVSDKDGNLLVYEIVVRGDVNSDGVADAKDSNLIKAIRNEVAEVLDVQKKAADIDNDGDVDLIDSKLLLYHRAEVKNYSLDYVK